MAHTHYGDFTIVGNLDLLKKELRNARIQNLGSAPSSPEVGQIYLDTVQDAIGVYTSEGWVYLGPSDEAPPAYTDEQVMDVVAAMIDAGTHLGITVSYDDADNLLSFEVDVDLDDVGDTATRVAMTPEERTKLSGVATGATANDTDANLKNRANHTGTQTSSTISDFATAVNALVTDAIDALVDSAPGTLDTLAEIAEALGEDPNFADTIIGLINAKPGKYQTTFGDGDATSFNIKHDLNNAYPTVEVYEVTSGARVSCEVTSVDADNLTLSGWVTAPTAGAYTVTVIG